MNKKQLGWIVFLSLNILLTVFAPLWWIMGFVIVFSMTVAGFLLLTVGYFSYAFYKHLGDEPIELMDSFELIQKIMGRFRGLATTAREEK